MFFYLYPRIDINVSKGMNHLLKSPFCIHPKSSLKFSLKMVLSVVLEKVSVPVIDIRTFKPDQVPKIEDLMTLREDGTLSKCN